VEGKFSYKNRANGVREDGFFRRKTDFFVFFKKGGFGGVAGEEIIRHKKK